MTRNLRALLVGMSVVLAPLGVVVAASLVADRVPDVVHPPHVGLPTAGASAPLPPAVSGADTPAEIGVFLRGIAEREWIEGVERAEREAAVASMARRAAGSSGVATVGSGDCAALAAEWGLPVSILWRESRCSEDAFNARGCSGRGCVGAAQLDLGHFEQRSPWGEVGWCSDLDPGRVEDQRECVRRLSRGGTYLGPWGE